LFHAGLLSLGATDIDTLVTGLPVSQYRDETRRSALADQLTGTHQVTRKREIRINTVKVVPQPLGAYLDLVYTLDDPDLLADSRVLVIDPGFFSVDWVVIEQAALHQSLLGTSQMATSMILEAVQTSIREEHGGKVSLAKLEQAVRSGKDRVLLLGDYVELGPYLATAAAKVVPVSMDALRQSMRTGGDSIDIVLIAGGGAALYEKQVRDLFPKSRIILPEEPVLANVRGFGRLADRLAS
jgi:plasmid segregation protein ParM